jgi:hypothetical protein
MGEEFSKKALERHRKDNGALKCKTCVAAAEQAERDQAAARRQEQQKQKQSSSSATTPDDDDDANEEESRMCAGKCGKECAKAAFNRNQWSKGETKSRCRECVEQAVQDESAEQQKSKDDKIVAARRKVEEANATGNAQSMVVAESELAALEAEQVTGLKPVKLAAGRGRGRSRGAGRGRGRGGKR